MSEYTSKALVDQVVQLSEKLDGPFPYEDCRHVLAQLRETETEQGLKRYSDLIPDLDAYFYLVWSHASGAARLMEWSGSELAASQKLLKNTFFHTHTRYREIAWMINEVNTPKLHLMLTVSDELRTMLQKLIADLVEKIRLKNERRQQDLVTA